QLRQRPPTEKDVNAEATEVLRALYWLMIKFRGAANPKGNFRLTTKEPAEDDPAYENGPITWGDFSPALRRYLRHISAIKVFTDGTGEGGGRRNKKIRGEILFHVVGFETGKVNPHHAGKEPGMLPLTPGSRRSSARRELNPHLALIRSQLSPL